MTKDQNKKTLITVFEDFDQQRLMPPCPNCRSSNNVIKSGIRKLRQESVQIYLCKLCKMRFSDRKLTHTTHPPKLILHALTYFNLGHTLDQTSKTMRRQFKSKIPISTLNSWAHRYQEDLPFVKLRNRYKIDPKDIIHSKKFHHQQVYEFKYHTLKTNIAGKAFPKLKYYITSITRTPNFIPNDVFTHGPRCSELRTDLKFKISTKHNIAVKLAELGQMLAKTNHERHAKVENFMLINDNDTLAIEVPIYIEPRELTKQEQSIYGLKLQEPLSGHIDILQVRFNKIHILDYKSDIKINDKATIDQLFLYALALSKRTKIPLDKFVCAYFNDKNYYQFSPGYMSHK